MELSEAGLEFIKGFEGLRLQSYPDSGGVWTIAFGCIKYPNGTSVKEFDECTEEQALEWLKFDVQKAVDTINHLTWNNPLNQAQFDALVSFHYNTGHLPGSTLYKKVCVNPNDETIFKYDHSHPIDTCEFTRWVRVKGKIITGLIVRRKKEADAYCSPSVSK